MLSPRSLVFFASNPNTKNCHLLMEPKLIGLKDKLTCQNHFIAVRSHYEKQHISPQTNRREVIDSKAPFELSFSAGSVRIQPSPAFSKGSLFLSKVDSWKIKSALWCTLSLINAVSQLLLYSEPYGCFATLLIQVSGNIECKVRMLNVPRLCKASQEYNAWHQRCHTKSLSPWHSESKHEPGKSKPSQCQETALFSGLELLMIVTELKVI